MCPPFGIQGLLVSPMKVKVNVDMHLAENVPMFWSTLGNIGYYNRFIKNYVEFITPMEEFLWKDVPFVWFDCYN